MLSSSSVLLGFSSKLIRKKHLFIILMHLERSLLYVEILGKGVVFVCHQSKVCVFKLGNLLE